MREDTVPPDAAIERLVHDFDDLAGRLHTLIDEHGPHGTPHAALWQRDREFTTEWQMADAAEEDAVTR